MHVYTVLDRAVVIVPLLEGGGRRGLLSLLQLWHLVAPGVVVSAGLTTGLAQLSVHCEFQFLFIPSVIVHR